mmetsp:Transcript_47605/g.58523  ORF Transcript_47605/g.58523 Transcript_47605/m.58523 type:complete len:128 (+) Transcript_47605:98-481(+)
MAVKPITMVISLLGTGYALAITLVILGCTQDKIQPKGTFWLLFLLGPYLFTPAMGIFFGKEDSENSFATQFALFMISFMFVCAFAMPLVFFTNDKISTTGLGFGLGADFVIYGCMAGAAYFGFQEDY